MKVEGTFTNNFTCDGIDGTGKITIGATSYGVGGAIPTVIQNIIFNNSTNSSFKGISKGQYNDPVANISADSELNIEMNAASSNAVQTRSGLKKALMILSQTTLPSKTEC